MSPPGLQCRRCLGSQPRSKAAAAPKNVLRPRGRPPARRARDRSEKPPAAGSRERPRPRNRSQRRAARASAAKGRTRSAQRTAPRPGSASAAAHAGTRRGSRGRAPALLRSRRRGHRVPVFPSRRPGSEEPQHSRSTVRGGKENSKALHVSVGAGGPGRAPPHGRKPSRASAALRQGFGP